MTERGLQRAGAGALVLGALLALVGNLLHPRIGDFTDPVLADLEAVSGSETWIPIHLVILFGTLLIIAGLYALARSLREDGGGYLVGRIALGSLLVSAPVAIVTIAVDTYATKAVADTWRAAGEGASGEAFAAGAAVVEVGWSLFTIFIITFLGITPILFGLAAIADRDYPAVAGWPAVVLGAAALLTGILGILGGPSSTFFLLFVGTSGLLTIWVLGIGVLLWRRSAAPAAVSAPA